MQGSGKKPGEIHIPVSMISAGVGLLIVVGLVVATVFTGITNIKPGEVAVVINNLTGKIETRTTNGMVIHLPFGLTKVYKLDKTVQPVQMTYLANKGDRKGDDSVQIKTNDGSNVNMDVEVQYRIDVLEKESNIADIVRLVGRDDAYKRKQLVRAYARSIIRDELGKLSVTEIADSTLRTGKLDEAKRIVNRELEPHFLKVTLMTAINPRFNPKYEKMIKDRIEADQDVRNQVSAQLTAKQEQLRSIAEAQRKKSVAIRKAEGDITAAITEATEKAKQVIARAKGRSYAMKKSGDEALVSATNEAKAIEYEGLARAKGIEKLAKAYEKGGLALVREALAEKFRGVVLQGQPYSLSSEVQRMQLEEAAAASRKKGGN